MALQRIVPYSACGQSRHVDGHSQRYSDARTSSSQQSSSELSLVKPRLCKPFGAEILEYLACAGPPRQARVWHPELAFAGARTHAHRALAQNPNAENLIPKT